LRRAATPEDSAIDANTLGTLIEAWNGTKWAIISSPSPGKGYNDLQGVACANATTCEAVGYTSLDTPNTNRTLAESGSVPAPSISSFSPPSGKVGATVKIVGTGLAGASKVAFNGKAAPIVADAARTITVTVPAGATSGKDHRCHARRHRHEREDVHRHLTVRAAPEGMPGDDAPRR
jgi:hypothetical protein